MEDQYNYYNPNENYHYGDRQPGQAGGSGLNTEPGQPKKEKRSRRGVPKALAVVGFAILFGVVSSAVFLASNLIGSRLLGLQNDGDSSAVSTDKISNGTSLSTSSSVVTSDVSDVVDKVMPSIVSITSMSVEEVQSFFGGTYQQKSEGAGTGIIIGKNDTELLIVTNNHVVSGSDTLTVSFDDESSVEAHIKGTDANYDVAVISVPLDSISADTK